MSAMGLSFPAIRGGLDRAGVLLSCLCAVHCVLGLVIVAGLGLGGGLLLDPHNEYRRSFEGLAEVVTPENLQLPYWLLNFEEMVEVLCSRDDISRSAESFILKDAILNAKRAAVDKEDERSEEHTSELPSLMRISYAVFCLKKNKKTK